MVDGKLQTSGNDGGTGAGTPEYGSLVVVEVVVVPVLMDLVQRTNSKC